MICGVVINFLNPIARNPEIIFWLSRMLTEPSARALGGPAARRTRPVRLQAAARHRQKVLNT